MKTYNEWKTKQFANDNIWEAKRSSYNYNKGDLVGPWKIKYNGKKEKRFKEGWTLNT